MAQGHSHSRGSPINSRGDVPDPSNNSSPSSHRNTNPDSACLTINTEDPVAEATEEDMVIVGDMALEEEAADMVVGMVVVAAGMEALAAEVSLI